MLSQKDAAYDCKDEDDSVCWTKNICKNNKGHSEDNVKKNREIARENKAGYKRGSFLYKIGDLSEQSYAEGTKFSLLRRKRSKFAKLC